MYISQAVQTPFGITVFGSSVMRVEPDIASLAFAVSRLKQNPKAAFEDTRKGAQSVRSYLTQTGIRDVRFSRITLEQTFRYSGSERQVIGYTATASFHVLLYELDRMEQILSGVVEAGANEVTRVEFQSRRLKEVRAEARRRAVEAAREKAELYCNAANIALGPVIHLEDLNPNVLKGNSDGHVPNRIQPDDDDVAHSFDPGSIVVGAAVMVSFKIAA